MTRSRFIKLGVCLLYIVLLLVIGAAGFFEQASQTVYHSAWFCGLWGLLFLGSVVWMAERRLWRRLPVFLLHVSLLIILIGAATTHFFGREGTLHLRTGDVASAFTDAASGREVRLPFVVRLDSFCVRNYAGTSMPSDFESHVSVGGEPTVISMNNILRRDGFRFYQSSFDADHLGTVLSVNADPFGIAITYFGYALFALSFLAVLCSRRAGFRRLLRAVAVLVCFAGLPAAGMARSVPTISAERVGEVARQQVVYNGRVMPFRTLAIDVVRKVYGSTTYKGLAPEQVVCGWMARPEAWKNEPMILVKDKALRERLGLSGRYASFAELFEGTSYRLANPTDKAERELDEKAGILLLLANGTLFVERPADVPALSKARVEAEIFYDNVPFAKILFMGNLLVGFVLFGVVLFRGSRKKSELEKKFSIFNFQFSLSVVYLCLAFGLCLLAFGLRWYIAGRVPMSNGSETMLFLALCLLGFTLLLRRRFEFVVPFGLILSGFALLVSWLGERNPQITPLMPVLNSPLLSLHVSTVMMAYALLAMLWLSSIAALLVPPARRAPLTRFCRLALYPAVLLLGVGIFLGAVWANVSWGRYWSWDPKEVWALITLMVYAVPFHSESLPAFQKPRTLHVYLAFAFLAVLFTYFGVNYLLGGMHSYA